MNVNLYAESAIQNYPAATMNSTHCKQKNNGTSSAGKQDSVEISYKGSFAAAFDMDDETAGRLETAMQNADIPALLHSLHKIFIMQSKLCKTGFRFLFYLQNTGIHARHQHIRRTARLIDAQIPAKPIPVDPAAVHMQQRRLRHGRQRLMQTVDNKVRTLPYRIVRHILYQS